MYIHMYKILIFIYEKLEIYFVTNEIIEINLNSNCQDKCFQRKINRYLSKNRRNI